MIKDEQKRYQILRKIKRIPSERLNELDEFVSRLEKETRKKTKITSFAGVWKDIDNSIFDDFTKNLLNNRQRNKRRIDE